MNDEKRLTSYYAWTEEDPEGGEGIIFAFIPTIGLTGNLAHRRLDVVQRALRNIAIGHQKTSGHKVRLVKFERVEDVEEL